MIRAQGPDMRTPTRGRALLVIGACSVLLLTSCNASETSSPDDETSPEEPTGESAAGSGEGLEVDATDAIASFGVSRSPAGQRVADYLATMDSDREPARKLAELRLNGNESVAELVKSYRSIALTRRIDRWKVVHTLGQLRTEHAIETLKSVAFEPVQAPVQQVQRADGHGAEVDPAFGQEMMIRARAVEGIEILAREGNSGAEAALLRVVSASALSARRAAVQAYLRLGKDKARRRREVTELLGPEDHWMLELRDVPTTYFNVPRPDALRSRPTESANPDRTTQPAVSVGESAP
jgi:hypothetical protein